VPVQCERVGSYGSLSTKHPSVHCYTPEWAAALALFLPLAVAGFGLPIWLLTVLRRAQAREGLGLERAHSQKLVESPADGGAPAGAASAAGHRDSSATARILDTVSSTDSTSSTVTDRRMAAVRHSVSAPPTHSIVFELLSRQLRPAWYWWPVVGLLQRLALLLLFAGLSSDQRDVWSQRAGYFCLVAGFLTAHLYVRPHKSKADNDLETGALFGLTLIAGLLASQTASTEPLNSLSGSLHAALFVFGSVISIGLALVLMFPIVRGAYQWFCTDTSKALLMMDTPLRRRVSRAPEH
jgi:hypothetical protein